MQLQHTSLPQWRGLLQEFHSLPTLAVKQQNSVRWRMLLKRGMGNGEWGMRLGLGCNWWILNIDVH